MYPRACSCCSSSGSIVPRVSTLSGRLPCHQTNTPSPSTLAGVTCSNPSGVRISARGLKTIAKNGAYPTLLKAGLIKPVPSKKPKKKAQEPAAEQPAPATD